MCVIFHRNTQCLIVIGWKIQLNLTLAIRFISPDNVIFEKRELVITNTKGLYRTLKDFDI